MLKKSTRMPRELFAELLEKSRYANSPHFSMRFRLGDGAQVRIGASVSKKISKKAVVRNTIRRRIYAALYRMLNSLPNGLYLFVAKAGAEKVKGELLHRELESLFVSAGVVVSASKRSYNS